MYKTMKKLMTAAMTLLLAACSGETGDLLESVPADVDYVAVTDLNKVVEAFNIEVENGKTTLPPSLTPLLGLTGGSTDAIDNLWKAVDTRCVVVYGYDDAQPVVTFRILDYDALLRLFGNPELEGSDGFDVGRVSGGMTLAVKGRQGWLLRASDTAGLLSEQLKGASKENITVFDGVAAALNGNSPIRMAMQSTMLGMQNAEEWSCVSIDLTEYVMSAELRQIDPYGNPVTTSGLQALSTDFLRYTPPTANMCAAIGATKATDWDFIFGVLGNLGGTQMNGLLQTVRPYLVKADGTVAMAANVDPSDPGAWGGQFLMMVHMPQDEVNSALVTIENRMRESGGSPRRDARTGAVAVSGGKGMSLYAAPVDGYLAVSSFPLTPTQNNEMNTYFLSKKAAIVLSLSDKDMSAIGMNGKLTLSLQWESDRVLATVQSQQPLAGLLTSILTMAL